MKLKITVHGVAYEVDVEVLDAGDGFPAATGGPLPKVAPTQGMSPVAQATHPASSAPSASKASDASGGVVTSPIAGTVLEIKCAAGDSVKADAPLLVVEAMKMETTIAAPQAGVVKTVEVAVGDAVREGHILVRFA